MSSHGGFTWYYREIHHLINQSRQHCRGWPDIDIVQRDKWSGMIIAENVAFNDGAYLKFLEDVEVRGRIPNLLSYAYEFHWIDGDEELFFRYERDPNRAQPFVHEEYHLHAFREEPRFMAPLTNFHNVFTFILSNFYLHR